MAFKVCKKVPFALLEAKTMKKMGKEKSHLRGCTTMDTTP